uniref:Uncharacterized protein n=1 Tax=Rhizophora mucronata TaxID=61149 RepID=A0A2P2JIM3_RHIMU
MGEGASPHPPSPRRSRGENSGGGEERPRFFDQKAKNKCWANAETVPGRHPERWRKDGAGNIVCKRFFNCYGCLCFEYDHIVPFSKGSVGCFCFSSLTRIIAGKKEIFDGINLVSFFGLC